MTARWAVRPTPEAYPTNALHLQGPRLTEPAGENSNPLWRAKITDTAFAVSVIFLLLPTFLIE